MTSEKDIQFPSWNEDSITFRRAKLLFDAYRQRLTDGHGYSGLHLIMLTQPSCMLSDDILAQLGVDRAQWENNCLKTLTVLLQNAEAGDFVAMQGLAFFYQNGYPPNDRPDYDKMKEWCQKAWDAGYRGQC